MIVAVFYVDDLMGYVMVYRKNSIIGIKFYCWWHEWNGGIDQDGKVAFEPHQSG
jgi:hypothetical protein